MSSAKSAAEISRMTLTEKFTTAESVARELGEHLQQALVPKLTDLRNAGKEYDVSKVTDQEILDRFQSVDEAEEFAAGLNARLQLLLKAIHEETEALFFGTDHGL